MKRRNFKKMVCDSVYVKFPRILIYNFLCKVIEKFKIQLIITNWFEAKKKNIVWRNGSTLHPTLSVRKPIGAFVSYF